MISGKNKHSKELTELLFVYFFVLVAVDDGEEVVDLFLTEFFVDVFSYQFAELLQVQETTFVFVVGVKDLAHEYFELLIDAF